MQVHAAVCLTLLHILIACDLQSTDCNADDTTGFRALWMTAGKAR